MPLMLWLLNIVNVSTTSHNMRFNQQVANSRGVVLQGILGINTIKTLNKDDYYCKILDQALATESKPYVKTRRGVALYQAFISIAISSLPIVLATVCVVLYSVGLGCIGWRGTT